MNAAHPAQLCPASLPPLGCHSEISLRYLLNTGDKREPLCELPVQIRGNQSPRHFKADLHCCSGESPRSDGVRRARLPCYTAARNTLVLKAICII